MSYYDEFTLEHLMYAREHFAEDIGEHYKFQMRAFFSMITPETEERFLEIMNNFPV